MLPSRSSVSRSAARRRPSTSGNVNSLLSPNPASFCVCWPSEPTKDSIEINLPKAGERLEGTAAYHSPLTSYVALWAFRGVGCAPKSGGLRTPAVLVSPSGLLRVLGGNRSPVAYAHRQRSAALRAEAKQPEAGERLEAIGVREQPLNTHHLHHMSPSRRLEVLGVRLSPAAYARWKFLFRPPGF